MITTLKGKTIARTGDGEEVYLRSLVNGEIGFVDFVAIQALKGRVFSANAGTVTTPVTWDASAGIAVTKPILWVSVPKGTVIIPLHISLQMEAFGTNAIFEANAQVGTGGSRTSGGVAVTPKNLRADNPASSVCTVYRGDGSPVFVGSTTNVSEFWRVGHQSAITKATAVANVSNLDEVKFEWKAKDSVPPICVGDCQFAVHQGSQAGTGFLIAKWIEIPATELP